MSRLYTRYTPTQKQLLKQHYHLLSNHDLAQLLCISSAQKVRDLARRLGVKWRAENGRPGGARSPAPR